MVPQLTPRALVGVVVADEAAAIRAEARRTKGNAAMGMGWIFLTCCILSYGQGRKRSDLVGVKREGEIGN